MKRYIFMVFGVLLFSGSHAQQLGNSDIEREVVPSVNNSSSTNAISSERFLLTRDGSIAEVHNDKPLYTGSVKNKKLHGSWQSWYQNGLLCDSGMFVRGLPDGEWKHWNNDGQLIAVRTYHASKYQRIHLEMYRYNPRRPAYPLTVMYHKNKQSASRYLHSSYSFPHTVKRIDDLSLQQWVITNITPGNTYHPVFDQSLHHGLFINYFPGGELKDSGYYNNGLRQGVWVEKESPDGARRQGNYQNGIRVKEWKVYNNSNQLTEIIFYNNKGEVNSRKSFRGK